MIQNKTNAFVSYLDELANKSNPMPIEGFDYQGYKITPVINNNPYLFHNWDSCSENSPKRRLGKTVYLITKEGYVDKTYSKSLAAAKKFVRKCNAL